MRLAVVAGPSPGHALPAIAFAAAAVRQGNDVIVVTGDRWAGAAHSAGADFATLPALPGAVPDVAALYARFAAMAPPTAALLRPWRPDAVVADTIALVGALAAGLLAVPWLELVPHPLSDPSRALPLPGASVDNRLVRVLAARDRRRGRAQVGAARRSLGLPASGPARLRLVATLPALESPRPDWPADAVVVGPLEWDPGEHDPLPPAGDGPLVVVSPTTDWPPAPALLAGLPGARVAVTTLDPPLRRQAPLLERADVVVTHGGHGTVAKALVRGVPLVVLPAAGDQPETARRLRAIGAAAVVATAGEVPGAVRRVLHDATYADAARAAGATLGRLGPAYAVRVAEHALGAS